MCASFTPEGRAFFAQVQAGPAYRQCALSSLSESICGAPVPGAIIISNVNDFKNDEI